MPTKKTAAQVAAETKEIVFEFDGVTYTVPPAKTWPLEAQEAEEAGQFATALKEILGEEQYKKFKKKPRTVGDLEDITTELFKAVEKALDVDSGE